MKPTMNNCPIFSRDVISLRATSQAPIDEVLNQQSGADPGRPLGNVGALPLAPIRARDVDVNPWPVAGKLAQEEGRCDHPAASASDVAHVRHIAAQLLEILIPERHLPDTFSRLLTRSLHLRLQFLVGAEHADRKL